MAYETPTVDDFIDKFPDFDYDDPARITAAIAEAMRSVDDTWLEGDYKDAILYLAAHLLVTDVEDQDAGSSSGAIASEHIGEISISYARQASDGSREDLSSTGFGRKYLALRQKNHPPIMVI